MRRNPGATLIVLVVLGSAPVLAAGGLAGRWQHDQGRSDRHYLAGEYPGRWMRIAIGGGRLEVEQAIGGVRDGIPIGTSGDETAVWSLPIDGSSQDVTIGKATRTMSAGWTDDGALELRSAISLGDEGDLEVVERWRVIDDGGSLEIERSIRLEEDERTRRIVFRRAPDRPTPGAGGP